MKISYNTIALNQIVFVLFFVDRTENHGDLSLLGGDRQLKPSPVDRTFDPLSNGMHNSFSDQNCHLEHYSTEATWYTYHIIETTNITISFVGIV